LAGSAAEVAGVVDEVGDAVIAWAVALSVQLDRRLSYLVTQARSRSRALSFLVATEARSDEA